ncbi:hypothetical protein GCM10009094_27040 [Massilia aurea]
MWGELSKEALGTVVSGALVYALTDMSLWASAFFGFVITTTFLNRSRFDSIEEQLTFSQTELVNADLKIATLENEVSILRERGN